MQWEDFFGQGNDLRWADLHAPNGAARLNALEPFLELVRREAPVAALPRVRRGRATEWYIGWREDGDARDARDLVVAFLGRSYANLAEVPRILTPSDAVERSFSDEFGGRAIVVAVPDSLREPARLRLLTMAKLLLRRPLRRAARVVAVGRLTRDVELALQQGNVGLAETGIDALRREGHVDAVNLEFLTIRVWAVAHEWAKVVEYPGLPGLLAARPPARTREVLIRAVYHLLVAPNGALPETPTAWTALLEDSVLPSWGALFQTSRGIDSPEGWVFFAVLPLLRDGGRDETVSAHLHRLENAGWRREASAIERVWRLRQADAPGHGPASTEAVPATDWLEFAVAAFRDDDLDRAWELAIAAPPGATRATMLVRCAALIRDPILSTTALAAWEDLPPDDQTSWRSHGRFSQVLANTYELVGVSASAPTLSSRRVVSSWSTWFTRLKAPEPWPGAISAADAGQASWSVEDVVRDEEQLSSAIDVITSTLPDWGGDALRNSLPFVIASFVATPLDVRAIPIADAVFELLETDTAQSFTTCDALISIAAARLTHSAQPSLYAQRLASIADCVLALDSAACIPLVARALEMLLVVPAAQQQVRDDTAVRLLSMTSRWSRQMTWPDYATLRTLAADLGVSEAFAVSVPQPALDSAAPERAVWGRLANKYVALYSLEEGALQRAERALKELCPGVRVSVFAEHGATAPMDEAARRADLFVIATRSAKHSATIAIETLLDARRRAYASGKGTTSLLMAVKTWLVRSGN